MFVLNGSLWDGLKANILESSTNNLVWADMLVRHEDETLFISGSKSMNQVKEIAFSITYDPELWSLNSSTTNLLGGDITEISNQAGISTYLITFLQPIDISPSSVLAEMGFQKTNDATAHINLIQANFTDSVGEIYLLSTTWAMF